MAGSEPGPLQTLELRTGSHPVKCKMIQIELVRIEVLPGSGGIGGAPGWHDTETNLCAALGQTVNVPVGAPITVWKAQEGKEHDLIQSVCVKSTECSGHWNGS